MKARGLVNFLNVESLAIAFNTTVARQYNITVSFAGQVLLDQTITVNPGTPLFISCSLLFSALTNH